MDQEGYDRLQRALKAASGLDLTAYKKKQVFRRLAGFMSRYGFANLTVLAEAVRRDPSVRQQLTDFLAINVSEFFRNPERFDHLKAAVLPELRRTWSSLRIWSAGCSVGAEAYSLAILLEEMEPGSYHRHAVLGTDIDREALREAEAAVFGADRLREVSPGRLQRFFAALPGQRWQVKPSIRRYVRFMVHNLLEDPYPSGQHLILCRNVVIYFNEAAKEKIFAQLAASLVPGGYLLVGSTEAIFYPARFGLAAAAPFLYRRVEG